MVAIRSTGNCSPGIKPEKVFWLSGYKFIIQTQTLDIGRVMSIILQTSLYSVESTEKMLFFCHKGYRLQLKR